MYCAPPTMSDAREISLSQQLWETLDTMAKEMGVARDSLVSQAVFTLARLNGYVIPGKVVLGANSGASAGTGAAPAHSNGPAPVAAKPVSQKPAPAPARGKGRPAPEPEPEPEPEPAAEEEAPQDEGNPFEEEQAQEEEAPAEDAPPEDEAPPEEEEAPAEEEPQEEEEPAPPPPKKGGAHSLTVVMAGREPFKLAAESMLVGRGKHCDFVIESNRVSREHARISRDGGDFVLEDLNSSNGTFFGPSKEKVTRPRKLKDGDEYTFGTEKVKFRIGR
jgi:hypothetical protein